MKKVLYIDNSGHITLETVGTFVPLVLLMVSILSLVNIVTVQARVHHALTQTAMALSIYSYAFEVIDLSNSQAGLATEDLDSIFEGIGSMTGSNAHNARDSISTIGNIANNVKNLGENYVLGMLILAMIKEYLANEDMSGDEYLRRSGIINMRLESVELPNRNGNVKLTIQYEAGYTFGALPLPFGPTLKVTQTAITRGWQGGSGEGYW